MQNYNVFNIYVGNNRYKHLISLKIIILKMNTECTS